MEARSRDSLLLHSKSSTAPPTSHISAEFRSENRALNSVVPLLTRLLSSTTADSLQWSTSTSTGIELIPALFTSWITGIWLLRRQLFLVRSLPLLDYGGLVSDAVYLRANAC